MQLKNLKIIISNIIGIHLYKKNNIFYILKRRNRRIFLLVFLLPFAIDIKYKNTISSQKIQYGYIKKENIELYHIYDSQKYKLIYNKKGDLIDVKLVTPIN